MNVLTAWQSLLGPEPQVSAHTATTRYVTAGDGSCHVLKRVDGLHDLGERRFRLVSEYRVLLHLSAAGVPVALPALTDDGRIFASAGESIYTLTPKLPADDVAECDLHPSAVYARIGAALGRLHETLRTYPHEARSSLPSFP